ncbi:Xaa-Pro aminopeptidase [Nematocida parisii]|uniref:Xaa-Pro aminopeptidase n=1 Tax=Nematocida parisii (strain ERTm3) TaxID=935791 RepID=I3EKC2_NEMP3|nr:uncharacterized protein NEPG_00796 [Nematocida parisii ERTm1]EIJ89669.1 hypothetical protein NEQG_00439 [Nematocida parisii ERTm3]KAI5126840.1 Xaa-Pro aminopeptidase [Nematocida parisii]EIJ94129.1 hypothetical protein NEPG_00796 [Nematocida parisii ERTm1]KAI5126920.1 Xaa-Pro aminopeptidase [Nematocida parisii]KAI5141030.1 Xaa-Pro aminopeptidase [Nematocida parisii]|eukprot:XP_013058625.1 hypothetical protein NEPG_00796 [Nematocida parisii ERTm1]
MKQFVYIIFLIIIHRMYTAAHKEEIEGKPMEDMNLSKDIPKEERISALRKVLAKKNVGGCVLYRRDPHLNEYVHPHYEHIAWLTGFTGSNATLLVLPDTAYLYTDGRYFIQAEKQLPKDVLLSRMGTDPTISQRLAECNGTIGINAQDITQEEHEKHFKNLPESVEIDILNEDIIDQLWSTRPKIEPGYLEVMGHQESVGNKLKKIRSEMKKNKEMRSMSAPFDMVIISDMDEIAWATNLRGSDIPMSRLFYSFLIVQEEGAILFTDASLTTEVPDVVIRPYADFYRYISEISDKCIGISSNTNYQILCTIVEENNVGDFDGILNLKAIKTEAEIKGFEEANKRDAVYLCMLFGEIKKNLAEGSSVGEKDVADRLLELKKEDPEFIVPSFETISGYGENGAIIHYAPEDNTTKLSTDSLFLIDSGSQYTMGTTDITRTVCFGKPTDQQKRDYTALIKGHIDLETTKFSEKTALGALSIIVRKHVWDENIDYAHSTGHGVGFGLNVHEGPQTLDSSSRVKALPGMNITIEPGIYREGKYGLRHENLAVVEKYKKTKGFLQLRNITPVPLHLDLIDTEILSPQEIEYINKQSKNIQHMLKPLLLHHKDGLAWLVENTRDL